jgi:signal transduction histidine kinase
MRRETLFTLAAGAAVVLCCILAVLQYRWTGELARADHTRLQSALQSSLTLLSREFNGIVSGSVASLQPAPPEIEALGRERAYADRYLRWVGSAAHPEVIGRLGLAIRVADSALPLKIFDRQEQAFIPQPWPPSWLSLQGQLLARVKSQPTPPPRDPNLIEIPRFGDARAGGREQEWLIIEPDIQYMKSVLLPELLRRYLGGIGSGSYDVRVAVKDNPEQLILAQGDLSDFEAEAAVDLFTGRSFGRGGDARWHMQVRSRGDSLARLVQQNRARNLAVSGIVLLLLLFSLGLILTLSRRAQRLAEMQMEFVAGVSHELRTPLTVIRTAAFNLKGRVARNPASVERYGELIEGESARLETMVEQVLQFAAAGSGRLVRSKGPVQVKNVVEEALHAMRSVVEDANATVEPAVDPQLPVVRGDGLALRHAVQNLIENAVKYGLNGQRWIGISAEASEDGRAVRIHVRDRGPGIPKNEQAQIFDAFYRGKRATADQIRGTGLGLNLVKKIAEAHGGRVLLHSAEGQGAQFTIELPAGKAS